MSCAQVLYAEKQIFSSHASIGGRRKYKKS